MSHVREVWTATITIHWQYVTEASLSSVPDFDSKFPDHITSQWTAWAA